jgi:hypothetical protein
MQACDNTTFAMHSTHGGDTAGGSRGDAKTPRPPLLLVCGGCLATACRAFRDSGRACGGGAAAAATTASAATAAAAPASAPPRENRDGVRRQHYSGRASTSMRYALLHVRAMKARQPSAMKARQPTKIDDKARTRPTTRAAWRCMASHSVGARPALWGDAACACVCALPTQASLVARPVSVHCAAPKQQQPLTSLAHSLAPARARLCDAHAVVWRARPKRAQADVCVLPLRHPAHSARVHAVAAAAARSRQVKRPAAQLRAAVRGKKGRQSKRQQARQDTPPSPRSSATRSTPACTLCNAAPATDTQWVQRKSVCCVLLAVPASVRDTTAGQGTPTAATQNLRQVRQPNDARHATGACCGKEQQKSGVCVCACACAWQHPHAHTHKAK